VHELRNALLPIITVVGIILGQTLGGAIVTETIFALPGVGTYLLQGINKYDMPVVMISVLFIAAMIGVINLFIDVLYMYVDPRLRSQFVKGYVTR
jgi:peptide/nickel transport system permease protein